MSNKITLPLETEFEILEYYLRDGDSMLDAGRKVGTSEYMVNQVLNKYNAKLPEYLARRSCTLNEDAFDKLNKKCKYFMGLLFSDGSIKTPKGNKAQALSLGLIDKESIESLRLFLGSDHKIHHDQLSQKNPNWRDQYQLTITSDKLCNRLRELGKYTDFIHPTLAMSSDFWRGYCDGNGSMGIWGKGEPMPEIQFDGKYEWLYQLW